MANNTIFDDVFRTMVEKMTYLVVPLINEVFHTSYPDDVEIVQLRNEHQLENGELITDARLLIGDKVYHIECQILQCQSGCLSMISQSHWKTGGRLDGSFMWSFRGPV